MEILYFAWLREAIGRDGETVVLPPEVSTVAGLIDWLAARGAPYAEALADRGRLRAAVDQRFAGPGDTITGAREVALFPPVTGG